MAAPWELPRVETPEMILGVDPERLVGKTIEAVSVEPQDYDRVHVLRLLFVDGSSAQISYWAVHADDASLELDVSESDAKVTPDDRGKASPEAK